MVTMADERSGEPEATPTAGEDAVDFGYQVALEHFAGPLDLLLYLVRRAEVDIADIPIAQIADQFVATIATWEAFDLDVAGDFILMAATLLEIKARLVAPVVDSDEPEDDEEDLVDPRADLIRQLLAYRRIKEGVQELEALERGRLQCHQRRWSESVPEDPEAEDGIDLDNADPMALFDAWDGVLKAIAGHRPRTVVYDDVPIEERLAQIERTMREAREAQLTWLLERAPTTLQRCGVVVAVLEGIRQKVVEAQQYEQYGPVYLRYRDEDERHAEPALPPEDEPAEAGKRRRRRAPLVTFRAGDGEAEAEPSQEVLEEVEELLTIETDDQRFLRELNEQTGVDDLLARSEALDEAVEHHVRERLGLPAPEGEVDGSDEAAPSALREIIEGEGDDEDEDDEFADDDDDEDDEFGDDDEFEDDDDERAQGPTASDAEEEADPAGDEADPPRA